MKISIFGLGYVGCVTAACLAKNGNTVCGIDINPEKIEMINSGKSPIIEKNIEEMLQEGITLERLSAIADPVKAVIESEASIVCVGTPSNDYGKLSLKAIKSVSKRIGEALRMKGSHHCVIFRSTVLPGTVRNILIPILVEASGRRVHDEFDVCFNPEFLREGSSVDDFYNPPFTVIGQETSRCGDIVERLYEKIEGPIEKTTYEIAEMLKYTCNSFHALKVSFANEIGVICKNFGTDSYKVMELFGLDKKLNISSAYLKPGFAFGGSCLPKDLKALVYKAKEHDIEVPILHAIMESNRLHMQRSIDWIMKTKKKKIGILGLSFKEGTDDLRESPMVTLVESLIGRGCQLRIYDSEVSMASIFGANKSYIEQEIPHISSLICSEVDEVIKNSELIVIGKRDEKIKKAIIPYIGSKIIFDLIRLNFNDSMDKDNYEGICW